jgi:hypothetical protein
VLVDKPFYDKTIWAGGPGISLGESLDLPLYGTGANANNPASRTLSGLKLTFDSDSADSMTVILGVLPQHEHSWEWVVDTAPTCGAEGVKHEECTVCHAMQSENTADRKSVV